VNVKPKFVYYDIRRKQSVCLIMYTHENDVDTQVLEVSMLDNGEPIELDADYTYSAAIVNRNTKALINDSISCELNDSGNVLIPIDNFHTLGAQDLLIELTITDSAGDQVLVTPFPLWIHVNASILDDAQVTPESQGTVPELLERATEALENAGDYENLDNKPSINGHELVGNKSSDDLGLQGKLTAGENITINANGEISASGGVTSYTELSDKPIIVGTEKQYYSQPITLEGAFYTKFFTFEQREDGNHNVKLRDISGVIITDNSIPYDKLSDSAQKAIFKDYGFYPYPPSDLFTNHSHAPASNGVWHIGDADLAGLPVAKNGRLYNYFNDGKRVQFYVTDCTYVDHMGTQQCFMRVEYAGNLGVWQEFAFKNDIVSVSSAAVNQNGTITFTMSDGSTVTTTGESVIGPQGPAGADGDDYVLTPQDKTDIANIVLSELPTTQGVLYGNESD